MALFNPHNKTRTRRNRRIYAAYEIGYTAVDFAAAILFFVGSVLFFYQSMQNPAIWMFVIGSFFFAMKPTIRLAREIHYATIGDFDDLESEAKG